MLNALGAHRVTFPAMLLLVTAACTREPPAEVPPPAAAADQAAEVAWAREALARNPDIEVLAVDPKGIFTVRQRQGGELRTIRMDELVAAPPGPSAVVVPEPAPPVADSVPSATGAAEVEGPGATGAPASGLTVTRDAGNISITGPGVSISTARAAPGATGAPAAATPEPPAARAEQRGSQPLVCQGGRLMHIDNRVIEFDGDGLLVQDGCDLYLTNSRISAGGTAIRVVRGKVHIVNSAVKGGRSSIDASQGAQVFMSGATIDGLQRRFDTAQINDLGDNRYR